MSSPRIRVMERYLVAGGEVARRDSLFHTLWVYDIGGNEGQVSGTVVATSI